MRKNVSLSEITNKISKVRACFPYGSVHAVTGGTIEAAGVSPFVSVGAACRVASGPGEGLYAEVTAIPGKKTILLPYRDDVDVSIGDRVYPMPSAGNIFPHLSWKGRIVNALAEPIDGKGELLCGNVPFSLRASAPDAGKRQRLGKKIALGVKALDIFTACRMGQRMGIFAGSGVGKSVLMSMLTRNCEADVKVIGLIGERGREVKEFIQDYLGPEGLANAVVIAATGDELPLMRRRAAYVSLAVAEFFRDAGMHVLCMIDSVTRFALAQREVGLSADEPPMARGFTPSVFSELPRLLERAGPGLEDNGSGMITGLFTVLVEGDDHNEPIADTVRGILDGHIVLERAIGERGRFPAVNLLKSVSRSMPGCHTPAQLKVVRAAKEMLSVYDDMRELIRLGAYKRGSDALVDVALEKVPEIERFLTQAPGERCAPETAFAELAKIVGAKMDGA
ncbi:MAG: FliI/YscN family ATPase [Rickettsiales bacterium]